MKNRSLDRLRNIGVIAHIDAGKTTTTERILFHTGMIRRLGNVDNGNTVTDFMPQERERGITIQAAAITCQWDGHQINLIDTPGHIDFTAEVQRCLRVLDGGVVVFDGVAGVEAQSETVWHQADRCGVPRIAFVNKMDRTGADLDRTVGMIRTRLKAHPIVVQMPIGREADFHGLIDLLTMEAVFFDENGAPGVEEIPTHLRAEATQRREGMIEALADLNDNIALLYLEGEEVNADTLVDALRKATLANRAVPVLCGAALRNLGVHLLLDAVVAYLPSPLDVDPVIGYLPTEERELPCQPDDEGPLVAQVFKISSDPYVGKLAFCRVYSGVLRRGMTVLNASEGHSERVGRLVRMHADSRDEVQQIRAGEIGALVGFKLARTGQTLSTQGRPVVLEQITFPQPVLSLSIAVSNGKHRNRLANALRRLCEEDPTLSVRYDHDTQESLLAGMGELHLEVAVDRLGREFGVDVSVGAPGVAYRETITRKVVVQGRQVKQTGGRGEYAVVELELEPLEAGGGFVFEDAVRGGAVPKEFISAVESGIVEAMKEGPLGKHPMVDIKATLVDGKYHQEDSSDLAFARAGAGALREGVRAAGPVLLEPIMELEVVSPPDCIGDVIGDLGSREANMTDVGIPVGGGQLIRAEVPLARMFRYATSLRSLTHGRGSFAMFFSHYQRVSQEVLQRVVAPAM